MDEQNKTNDALFQDAPYAKEITALYDAQREAQLQQLKGAYDQSVQTLQQEQAKIAPTYATQANDLAAQYERTRMNNNLQAANNGLNTGAGSQMALAQQGNYLSAYGGLKTQQAQAEQAIQNRLAEMEISYKNAVAQAIADNDYQRAAALFAEYKNAGMGGYGSGGYSGGGGGRSRGSGSTIGAIVGAGSFNLGDGQTPTALSSSLGGSQPIVSDDEIEFLQYRDRYGSDEQAYTHIVQDRVSAAKSSASIDAIRRGLVPGTSAYNKYIDTVMEQALINDQKYNDANNALRGIRSDQLAEAAKQRKIQQRESYEPYSQSYEEFMRQAAGMPSNQPSSPRGTTKKDSGRSRDDGSLSSLKPVKKAALDAALKFEEERLKQRK